MIVVRNASGALQQNLPQFDDSVGRCAIDKSARRVHGTDLIISTPAADRIEVLQRITERKEILMACDAGLDGKLSCLRSGRQLGLHRLRVSGMASAPVLPESDRTHMARVAGVVNAATQCRDDAVRLP